MDLLYHNDAVIMLQRALALRPRDAGVFSKLMQAQVIKKPRATCLNVYFCSEDCRQKDSRPL